MEDEAKTSLGAKHVDNKVPQNITIPKIDKFCLLHCMPNRREYGDILDILSNGRLNMALELKDSWIFPEIKLVINNHLTASFFAKRIEMKKLGRHNRELEDKFSFLVVPRETATDIAQHGLCVGSTTTKELGNPEMGVYLFRHIDVALNVARQKKMSSFVVLIFKVFFGKAKTVQPRSALKSITDPTPNFDSHISKKVPVWNDPFDEQVINSLIYVYEYDGNTKPVKSPRQCLLIAAVEATFRMEKATRATVPVRLPSEPIVPGNPKPASCTVVKRIEKGKDAIDTYQSLRPPFVKTTGIQTNQSNVSDKEASSVPNPAITPCIENRIDWKGIFGMEIEKVNATLETLQCSSVRRARDPSATKLFPDIEITIENHHYMRAGCFNNNIAGEMKPSIEIKETISKTFADINDVPQDRHITDFIPGKEVNAKQVESSSNKIEDSSPNMKAAEIPKPPTADRKCLTESTQVVIDGASIQDFKQNKVKGGSATKMLLSPSSKATICCPETPEDHTRFSTVIVPDKESTVPVVVSLKTPSDGKEKHALNYETHREHCMLYDDGQKRGKLSLLLSKSSNKQSHTINEKNRLNGKEMKDFASITTKGAKTSGLSLNKLSNILQKASETDSLRSLQNCSLVCQEMISSFIKSFEKKQLCVLKDVVVDRKLLVEENLKTRFRCTLKPQAIEAFLELQIVLEISQFVENRIRYIEGKPTFRSLLWYDESLYTELLTGESGYQQQSNIFTAFQEKLKLNSLATLEKHHHQLSEYLQDMKEKDSYYYVSLKFKRELQECEDVLKHNCDYTAFSLSVPFSCGVNLGDTLDDLTALQKSTLEIIRIFVNLPTCDQGKKEHAISLLEVIATKINHIKTSVSTSLQLSLFGIEHLHFDAAKIMAYNEIAKYCGKRKTITKELISQINSIALSKLYCVQCEQPVGTKNSSSNPHQSSEVFGNQEVLFFGKIIDQAQCAEPGVLQKMIQNCNQHLEFQSKLFQAVQQCIVDEVIIQETNVLDMAERQDKHTTRLKCEAVESYIDLTMTYETLHFLNCLIASKNNHMRTRGLLWYDTSLFSDLIHNQSIVQPLLQGHVMLSAMDVIDRTISEIKSELDVISNCSNSVNYTYAFQIMTRELSELSELKIFMKSKPAISTYINVSPFVASLHFGKSLTDLNYNYNQLSDYLEVLRSMSQKDLGKLVHTLKIMKTIEFMKLLTFTPGISSFDFISCNVLHNRKKHSQTLKRETQEKKQILNSDSFKKRTCTEVSAEDSIQSSSKKLQHCGTSEKTYFKKQLGKEEESLGSSPSGRPSHTLQKRTFKPATFTLVKRIGKSKYFRVIYKSARPPEYTTGMQTEQSKVSDKEVLSVPVIETEKSAAVQSLITPCIVIRPKSLKDPR